MSGDDRFLNVRNFIEINIKLRYRLYYFFKIRQVNWELMSLEQCSPTRAYLGKHRMRAEDSRADSIFISSTKRNTMRKIELSD